MEHIEEISHQLGILVPELFLGWLLGLPWSGRHMLVDRGAVHESDITVAVTYVRCQAEM